MQKNDLAIECLPPCSLSSPAMTYFQQQIHLVFID